MGSSHSDLAHKPNVHYNPKYDLIQKSFDPHYGEVKFIREKTSGQNLILKEMVFNNKKTFENEASYFGKLVNLNHPNLVNLVGYNLEDDHGFCSTHFKISVYIENIEQTLQSEFDYRKSTGKAFNESEVTFIAENLISALSYFQGKGYSHGDIRPFNIFIKNQFYKLSDPALNALKGSNGLALTIAHGAKAYLAPELLEQVPKHRFDISSDPYRADVFSLGITLLSLATLTRGEDLYDYKKGIIDGILLEQRLDAVRHLYSKQTYELIRSMLNLNKNNRPDFITLTNRGSVQQPDEHEHHHHHQEVAKRSYLVENYHSTAQPDSHRVEAHHEPTPRFEVHQAEVHHQPTPRTEIHHAEVHHDDDLEARIRAALNRSDETKRNLEVKKSSYIPPATVTDHHTPQTNVYSSYTHTSHVTPASTYIPAQTYTHHTPIVEKTVELGTHHRDQEVVKSSVPQSHHDAKPDYYTSYTHNTYTAPTSTYTYTHTPVVEKTVEFGTHHKDQEVVKSSVPQDHHVAKPDVYSSYTHTSHITPASTYTYTPATTHEVKSYAHDNLGSYTYNPAPATSTYTTNTHHIDYTAGTEKALKPAAPATTETKHDIANFNFAHSYTANPTPAYEGRHYTQGSGGAADEGERTDRTAISINVGDSGYNPIGVGAQGAPTSSFATKTYEYTTTTGAGNQANIGSNLGFFQNVVSDAHAGKFADQFHGAATGTSQYANH